MAGEGGRVSLESIGAKRAMHRAPTQVQPCYDCPACKSGNPRQCVRFYGVKLPFDAPAEPVASNPIRSSAKFKRHKMNRTESAMAARLHAQQQRGEIEKFTFEGVRLKWGIDEKTGQAMNYKADFSVVRRDINGVRTVALIEVKGAHIWSRDLVRFKGCRAEWPCFDFQMWQLKKGDWKKLL